MRIKNYFQDCHLPIGQLITTLVKVFLSNLPKLVNSINLKFLLLENLKRDTSLLPPLTSIVILMKYL